MECRESQFKADNMGLLRLLFVLIEEPFVRFVSSFAWSAQVGPSLCSPPYPLEVPPHWALLGFGRRPFKLQDCLMQSQMPKVERLA